MPYDLNTEALRRRFQDSRERFPHYGPFLDFWEKILQVQYRHMDQMEPPVVPAADSPNLLKVREGFPLVPFQEAAVPAADLRALFMEILQTLGPATPKISPQLPLLADWLSHRGLDFQYWLAQLLRDDGRAFVREAESCGLDPEILLFLFLASWKPFLKSRARALEQAAGFDWTVWTRGFCPVCGGPPLLAYLREDGKRWGVCSLCEFPWNLPRLLCPECGNADPQRLRYFFAEGEKGRRVEVCDVCGHYLKTIDLGEVGWEPLPVLDDLLTTHLDLWAKEKGFRRLSLTEQIV